MILLAVSHLALAACMKGGHRARLGSLAALRPAACSPGCLRRAGPLLTAYFAIRVPQPLFCCSLQSTDDILVFDPKL